MSHRFFFLGAILFFLISSANPAYAYIGPAIAVLSSLFGPVVALVVMVILTLFFPILKLYRKLKSGSKKDQDNQENPKNNDES